MISKGERGTGSEKVVVLNLAVVRMEGEVGAVELRLLRRSNGDCSDHAARQPQLRKSRHVLITATVLSASLKSHYYKFEAFHLIIDKVQLRF